MGPTDVRLNDMASRTTAEKIVLVNIVIIAICVPLLIYCVVRQLWFPAVVFAFLTLSNGYQLLSARRVRPPE